MKVRDLKDYCGKPEPRPILHCQCCGSDYSADSGDYFMSRPDTVLKCCERPLVLAFKKTIYVEATP